MNVFEDNSRSIGRTPLVRLRRIAPEGARVYAKIEGRNPGYSAKDRIGAAMIDAAEAQGLLKPGMEIVEPTSGNTGIALAFVAAARGYKLTLTMPESMSIERRKILKALGARLALTPAHLGMKGSIERAEELVRSEPGKYYMPQQFENPANPDAHEHTTGPEIWNDTDGQVDVVVAGIGTGGTLTGVARYFKRRQGRKILAIGVEPAESATITQTLAGKPLSSGANRIQGLGAGFIPKTLDLTVIDRVETVTSADAIAWARRLCLEEGILSGISCGAAAEAACRLAAQPEFEGKTIVVILPDSGERYLSGPLFDGVFEGIETATAGTIL